MKEQISHKTHSLTLCKNFTTYICEYVSNYLQISILKISILKYISIEMTYWIIWITSFVHYLLESNSIMVFRMLYIVHLYLAFKNMQPLLSY